MAVAEALARGLPVVSTPTGAIADLLADHRGILVPAGDAGALAAALAGLLSDRARLGHMAAAARDTRDRLPSWESSAAQMAEALTRAGRV
jgi:glycosyltransferase involved in cell wall biosynthesis